MSLTVAVQNVIEQPSLRALMLSTTSLTIGSAASGAINDAAAGSSIAAADLPSGLTINGPARTWAWSGTGSAGSTAVTLTETVGDSPNSPRASTVDITIAEAGAAPGPQSTTFSATTASATSSDGTPPGTRTMPTVAARR